MNAAEAEAFVGRPIVTAPDVHDSPEKVALKTIGVTNRTSPYRKAEPSTPIVTAPDVHDPPEKVAPKTISVTNRTSPYRKAETSTPIVTAPDVHDAPEKVAPKTISVTNRTSPHRQAETSTLPKAAPPTLPTVARMPIKKPEAANLTNINASSSSWFQRDTSPDIQDESGWDVAYSDGACKGNGKPGSIAGIGVWWRAGDPR